jgi:CDP-glucose 4,6-dehydratase
MHVLVTGHTGFKGAWVTLLLSRMGHRVSGISLAPVDGGLFKEAQIEEDLLSHEILDIRERDALAKAIEKINPDAVMHMAAQPLVINSYKDPQATMDINVTGTLNVLEASKRAGNVKAVLIVTTDKVYKDTGAGNYSEEDALGGFDPYSASKAMADLLAQTYSHLDLPFKIGIARAGNVIGLGDVSENRLIPDITRSWRRKNELVIRQPEAVRPWQHVLDCVNGYVYMLDYLVNRCVNLNSALILNFGPDPSGYRTVAQVTELAENLLQGLNIKLTAALVKETQFLTLNSSRARETLNWRDMLSFEEAVNWSLEGISDRLDRATIDAQLERYLDRIRSHGKEL